LVTFKAGGGSSDKRGARGWSDERKTLRASRKAEGQSKQKESIEKWAAGIKVKPPPKNLKDNLARLEKKAKSWTGETTGDKNL